MATIGDQAGMFSGGYVSNLRHAYSSQDFCYACGLMGTWLPWDARARVIVTSLPRVSLELSLIKRLLRRVSGVCR